MQTLSLGIDRLEPSSTTPTAVPSCANESPMDGSPTCACTKETFGCSIHPTTPGAWIASQADSLARILARLERDRESTAIDQDFGQSSPACLAWFDPDSHSLRTAQCSLFEDSTACYLALPRSGTMRNGRVYPRPPLALPTSEIESGYWQTPVADDCMDRAKGKVNSRGEPKLSAQVKLWPTPTKSDGTGGPGCSGRDGGQNLRTAVAKSEQIGGSLNPTWVEWLMAWPLGYTVSRLWETAKSRSRRLSRGRS